MSTFKINNQLGETDILLGQNLELIEIMILDPATKVITDSNVYNSYKDLLKGTNPIVVEPGEQSKNFETYLQVQRKLLNDGVDRSYSLIGFGGGVVTDLTGFIASTYLRGLDFTLIPTSLLGMIDASIGGKTGINLDGYKNIIGTFNQPNKIIIHSDLLDTLPQIELLNGFSEAIKIALIKDKGLFEFLFQYSEELIKLNYKYLEELIRRCVELKLEIVNLDTKEKGFRKLLNFGHTIGHAIEKIHGIPHGQAVSIGMMIEAELSQQVNLSTQDRDKVKEILNEYKLPTEIEFDREKLLDAIYKDKKKTKESIDLITLNKIGEADLYNISFFELNLFLKSFEFS